MRSYLLATVAALGLAASAPAFANDLNSSSSFHGAALNDSSSVEAFFQAPRQGLSVARSPVKDPMGAEGGSDSGSLNRAAATGKQD